MVDQHERDNIAAYALGLLDDAERPRVEAHLRDCPGCARELAQQRAALELIPHALPAAQAPASAWNAIASRIRRERVREAPGLLGVRRLFSGPRLQPALLGVLTAAVLGLIGWNVFLQSQLVDGDTPLDSVVSRWQSGPVTVVALVARPGADDAGGRLVMSHDRKEGGLLVSGLPAPSEDRAYQIWFVRADQTRAPANTFAVDSHGQAVFLVDVPQPADDFDGVAITEEPGAGSAAPTGPDLLAGLIYSTDPGS